MAADSAYHPGTPAVGEQSSSNFRNHLPHSPDSKGLSVACPCWSGAGIISPSGGKAKAFALRSSTHGVAQSLPLTPLTGATIGRNWCLCICAAIVLCLPVRVSRKAGTTFVVIVHESHFAPHQITPSASAIKAQQCSPCKKSIPAVCRVLHHCMELQQLLDTEWAGLLALLDILVMSCPFAPSAINDRLQFDHIHDMPAERLLLVGIHEGGWLEPPWTTLHTGTCRKTSSLIGNDLQPIVSQENRTASK